MNNLSPKFLLNLPFIAVALLVVTLPEPAFASEQAKNWYTIEVITFTRSKSRQVEEKWYGQIAGINAGAANASHPLSESQWQLTRHAYSLGRTPGIKIQSHQAWRQAGLERKNAPWIRLKTGSEQLTGKIRISLSRYLHAELDIALANPDWSQSDRISFKTSRRLKRNEIHYIDHPLAGALIWIERYDMPRSTIETGTQTAPQSPKTEDTVDKTQNQAD